MTQKSHDILRLLQMIIPDIVSLYCILDKAFGWGHVSVVEALVPITLSLLAHVAQWSSNEYFSTKTIITKILPDKPQEEETEVQ